MNIISIANQKGGVAKTTTAQAICAVLNAQQKKTLAIDIDPQGNLSFAMGAVLENVPTIYEVLKGELTAEEILQTTNSGDILPANILLSGADIEFTATGREYLLREVLTNIKEKYEYIIIDCPPSLSILTINAFTASKYIVTPVIADVFSLQGMSQLNNTIQSVRKYCNPELKVAGVLLTKYTQRTNLGAQIKEILNDICAQMDTRLFETNIRSSVALQEAQLQQYNISEYDKKSNGLIDYIEFIKELEGVIHG